MSQNPITVIYDGDCDLCAQSVTWLAKRLTFTALAFQTADLSPFGLTRDECSKSVHAISGTQIYSGAPAVAFLLQERNNRFLSSTIRASGPIGRWSYHWIATHRHTHLVGILTQLLTKLNKRRN